MDYGALNGYFDGAVAKTLAAVDISPAKSNQHEFNGTGPLRALFGDEDLPVLVIQLPQYNMIEWAQFRQTQWELIQENENV